MSSPLEDAAERAVDPVVGVVLIVGVVVLLSASVGTLLIGFGSDLEAGAPPEATVEIDTVVAHDTDGFVTLTVEELTRAEAVELTATTDGSATIATDTGATDSHTERVTTADEQVTFRKAVDGEGHDVELRLVAIATDGDRETTVFDRTVIL